MLISIFLFDVISWRHPHILYKHAVKGANGRKTGGECHLCHAAALFQQVAGMFHTQAVNKVCKTNVHTLFKNMRDIIFAQMQFLCQNIQRQWFRIILGTIRQDALDTVVAGIIGQ